MMQATKLNSVEALRIAISDPRRASRRINYEIYKLLDPVKNKRRLRRVGLQLRNVILRSRPIAAKVAGHELRLTPEGVIAEILWSGEDHEPAEVDFVCRFLCKDSVFLDIGANVGIFSLAASKACLSSRIFAFEPTRKTFSRLSRNISLNDATNVVPVRLALGNSTGEATLNINVIGKDGLNTLGRLTHPDSEPAGTEIVPITTLDKFLTAQSVDVVNLMKVDAEGAELFIFEGAKDLLQGPNAPIILYEALLTSTHGFDYHPVEIFWLLDRWGFSCFALDSISGKLSVPRASRAYGTTVVAIKPSHPAYATVRELAH